MAGQETRVTKISKLQDRISVSTESCLVTIHGPEIGKKYILDDDEFTIAIIQPDGWYHAWPRDRVQVEIHDPRAAHRALTEKYSDSDIHNLFAYLETLK